MVNEIAIQFDLLNCNKLTLFWDNDSLQLMPSKKSKEKKNKRKRFAVNCALVVTIVPWLVVLQEMKGIIPADLFLLFCILWIYYSEISNKEKFLNKLRRKLEKNSTELLNIFSFSVIICYFLLRVFGLIILICISFPKVFKRLNEFKE